MRFNDENNPAGERKPHAKSRLVYPISCKAISDFNKMLSPCTDNHRIIPPTARMVLIMKEGIPEAKGTYINSLLKTMSNFKQVIISSSIHLVQNSNRPDLLKIVLASSQALRQPSSIVPVGSVLPKPSSGS